jgi:predicted DNA-binding transcriptional regulator YafY
MTFTPEEIRELIANLRQRQGRETTFTDDAANALEYLLQSVDALKLKERERCAVIAEKVGQVESITTPSGTFPIVNHAADIARIIRGQEKC